MKTTIALLLVLLVFKMPTALAAGDFVEDQPSGSESGDSTFDPFSDYSEFEEGSEEEADTNFFRNGRFFTIALAGGYEAFTDVLGQMYKPDINYGVSLTYFFDLKFGFQVGYKGVSHGITIIDLTRTYTGRVELQQFEFDAKYYFNTQNVTKGLGKINPYLIGGMSTYTRRQTFNGATGFVQDTAFGFQAGAGIEIPFMRNKMYFGAQGTYSFIAFADRNSPITINGTATNIYPAGDALSLMGMVGVNF